MPRYDQLRVQAEAGGLLFEGDPQTRSRVDFDVTYDLGEAPKASLVVYNPPEGFASRVRRGSFVRVAAGWDGALGAVFAGTPAVDGVEISDTKADMTVTVKIVPGAEAWRKAISVGGRGQVSYEAAVRACISDMGLRVGVLDLSGAPTYLPRAAHFEGPGWRRLHTYARSAGAEVAFDGETVSILRPHVGVPPGRAEVPYFAQDNGAGALIGTPKHTDKGLTFETFFDTRIRLGHRVGLDYYDKFAGQNVRGVYTIRALQHTGSSHGDARTTRATARFVGGL